MLARYPAWLAAGAGLTLLVLLLVVPLAVDHGDRVIDPRTGQQWSVGAPPLLLCAAAVGLLAAQILLTVLLADGG